MRGDEQRKRWSTSHAEESAFEGKERRTGVEEAEVPGLIVATFVPLQQPPPRRAERNMALIKVKILALIWPLFGRGLPEPLFCERFDAWLVDMLGRSEEGEEKGGANRVGG